MADRHFKDEILDQLSSHANVAQFVSFSPRPIEQRFSRVRDFDPNHSFESPRKAIDALLRRSPDGSVNLRSYEPDQPRSRTFLYGIKKAAEVVEQLELMADQGLYTIVNETIDVEDGGVSGVAFGGALEFAPKSTPRCVEKPGTAELPFDLGSRILRSVYGFDLEVPCDPNLRTEFSLHPIRRGFGDTHTVLWEQEKPGDPGIKCELRWPNKFSKHVGDKVFGLLVADAVGLPVPAATVLPRWLPPFSFGTATGSGETWLRTCPVEQVPGRFTTRKGWTDPFRLMAEEDPDGTQLASILAQQGVNAEYSGALLTDALGKPFIEGRRGSGEGFMLGDRAPTRLPKHVEGAVEEAYQRAYVVVGPVRMEWVFDGSQVWVVQLHAGVTKSLGRTVFPGSPSSWREIAASEGLEVLRAIVEEVRGTDVGVVVRGSVGMTSHMADLLRKARIPSKILRGKGNGAQRDQMALFES